MTVKFEIDVKADMRPI